MSSGLNNIEKIVIVGGGSAGWIAAAALSHELRHSQCKIHLVESEEIGTIGVGEAVIPPFIKFLHGLEIDERDFIQHTQASFKLGIEFRDWKQRGERYFHPFGGLGTPIGGRDFYHCWLKARRLGDPSPLMSYSPAAVMARGQRFMLPFMAPKGSPILGVGYALHFDAGLVAKYLRRYAEKKGVVRTEGMVAHVALGEEGGIDSVLLKDGQRISGDFFIDCTGFKGLLIEETLQSGYEHWKRYLPCDRAVAVQTTHNGEIPPYTISTARESGWTWRIPLQHRTGNGYVFSGDHCSDEQAVETLLRHVDGEVMGEPRVIPFRTGMRKEIWKKNCLSLGLASGFLEPLESTAIHLVTRGLQFFIRNFPTRDIDPVVINEFNRRMAMDYKEIRDFIILHYCATQRSDTPFWSRCQTMDIPDSLKGQIDLFKARGALRPGTDELFKSVSWRAVFEGMGMSPAEYYPLIDSVSDEALLASLREQASRLETVMGGCPSHREFIQKHCPAVKSG